ncbi:MAG: hypothetical protein IJR99_04160 [Kiritimatiellae bacterium]|nr:hypothetical protein [Kiritimatiellia bacterium]
MKMKMDKWLGHNANIIHFSRTSLNPDFSEVVCPFARVPFAYPFRVLRETFGEAALLPLLLLPREKTRVSFPRFGDISHSEFNMILLCEVILLPIDFLSRLSVRTQTRNRG